MGAFDALANYRRSKVETATPHQLITMIYDAAIRWSREAAAALEVGDKAKAGMLLIKAQEAVTELMAALDFERGGDLAKQLYRLYTYMHKRLVHANIKSDHQAANEVAVLLDQLADAWKQIIGVPSVRVVDQGGLRG